MFQVKTQLKCSLAHVLINCSFGTSIALLLTEEVKACFCSVISFDLTGKFVVSYLPRLKHSSTPLINLISKFQMYSNPYSERCFLCSITTVLLVSVQI